jgi:hypothetical protein
MEQQRYDEQYATTEGDPNKMNAPQTSGEALSTADLAGAASQPATQEPPGAPTMAEDTMREERPTAAPQPAPQAMQQAGDDTDTGPLLADTESKGMRARWDEIQTGFVDDPRQAVERADQLVAEAMKRLAETFANERNNLESQWSRGDQVDTEDLRVALRRYRAFFGRLLSV